MFFMSEVLGQVVKGCHPIPENKNMSQWLCLILEQGRGDYAADSPFSPEHMRSAAVLPRNLARKKTRTILMHLLTCSRYWILRINRFRRIEKASTHVTSSFTIQG